MSFNEWFKQHYIKRGFISSLSEAQEIWDAAVKDCEKICKEHAKRNFPVGNENSDRYHAQADWAEQIAKAIRNNHAKA